MCIPYKKGIMQESHTYYLLSKYMDHTISTEELKTLRLLVNLSDDDELSLSLSLLWENGRPFEEVDERLHKIMIDIFAKAADAAERYGVPGNYVAGANIAGFEKVVEAMIAQGIV